MKRIVLIVWIYICASPAAYNQNETVTQLTFISKSEYRLRKNLRNRSRPLVDYDIDWRIAINSSPSESGKFLTSIIIQTTYDNLVYRDAGEGIFASRIRYYIRIVSDDKNLIGFVENDQTVSVKESDLWENARKPVRLRKVFDLPTGKYKADVVFTDRFTGVRKVKSRKFTVTIPDDPQPMR